METHSGTHFDAPYHMLKDGKKADEIPLENFIGRATVVEVNAPAILPEHLPSFHESIVLFKTPNTDHYDSFRNDFTYLSIEAAKKLVEQKVKLVGIDYLSIEKFGSSEPVVHKLLMENGVIIVEGLYMKNAGAGTFDFICLPLNMSQDGSPCRAVLR